MAGNRNAVCISLGYTSGNGSHTTLSNQFHRHHGVGVYLLKVEDQLCKIFNRVNIVMWRRRNQGDTRHRIT